MNRYGPAVLKVMALLLAAGSGLLLFFWLWHAFGRDGLIPSVLATPGRAAQKAVILAGLAIMGPVLVLFAAWFGRRL